MAAERPLIVIIGPTASGKTGLALRIARQFNGEIISADSRAIYRGMDIGTAKPTKEELSEIQHWGIDLVNPDDRFTVYDFKKYVDEKIADIRSRNKLPILAGGSGLYVDAVIFDYQLDDEKNTTQERELLDGKSVNELIELCKKRDITLPENYKNKRYLIRAIERAGRCGNDRRQIISNTTIVGISTTKDELMNRIIQRSDNMFSDGVIAETERLSRKFNFELESMKSNIYPIVKRLIDGEIGIDEAKALVVIDDWRLARKQMTWFRRNPFINWLPLDEAEKYLQSVLE